MPAKTVFKRIIDREIPAKILYEDDLCLAFADTNPQAPTHLLVIPKKELKSISDLENEDLALAGHLLLVCRNLAKKFGLADGYRIVTNTGPPPASRSTTPPHLLGGRAMTCHRVSVRGSQAQRPRWRDLHAADATQAAAGEEGGSMPKTKPTLLRWRRRWGPGGRGRIRRRGSW
jgi:histidine triad (HIT) family protein